MVAQNDIKQVIIRHGWHGVFNLPLPLTGVLKIKSVSKTYHGLSVKHETSIDINGEYLSTEWFEVFNYHELDELFCSHLLDHGFFAEVVKKKVSGFTMEYRINFTYNHSCKKTLEKIKSIQREGGSNFRFQEFEKIIGNILTVNFIGHEVGGSYVPETAVIPYYQERIYKATSLDCEFVNRRSGGIGSDIYKFNIKLKKSLLPKTNLG